MHWPSGEASPAWAALGHPVPGRGRGFVMEGWVSACCAVGQAPEAGVPRVESRLLSSLQSSAGQSMTSRL